MSLKTILKRYYRYRNKRFHEKNAPVLINNYLDNHDVKKLQIGCQAQLLTDWLNVDIEPKSREVAFMDATKPFPFQDGTFDYIFSEHMVEHISFKEGDFMFSECYRVLKKQGKIRISTPDLQFLAELLQSEKNKLQESYLKFSKKYLDHDVPPIDAIVVNNFFRDWGHQFIHDKKTLTFLLEKNGFHIINFHKPGKSDDGVLSNLEKHGNEIGDEFNELESVVVQAMK